MTLRDVLDDLRSSPGAAQVSRKALAANRIADLLQALMDPTPAMWRAWTESYYQWNDTRPSDVQHRHALHALLDAAIKELPSWAD